MNYPLFISCPRGLEYLLESELILLGLTSPKTSPNGVRGEATLAAIYRICLWSRIANRVHLLLFSGEIFDKDSLYQLVHRYPWHTMFTHERTLAIECHGTTKRLQNTMFSAQVIKDAIVDNFRKSTHQRPNIDKVKPDVRIEALIKHNHLEISIDLAGFSLHKRGYRTSQGRAPLKENLACALLLRANWPQLAKAGYDLLDPFCGSGTLLIEGALMAANIAPGLYHPSFSFMHLHMHQSSLWSKIKKQALDAVISPTNRFYGFDKDKTMVDVAHLNAEKARVLPFLTLKTMVVDAITCPSEKGLIITNPPYGERMDDSISLRPIYQVFGEVMAKSFVNWQAAFLTSDVMLAKATGLRSHKQYTFKNGQIDCKLYCLDLKNNQYQSPDKQLSNAATMFKNRLKKNHQHLKKWAQLKKIDCYRVYDADLPEYAVAIDIYKDSVVIAEYAPPQSVSGLKAQTRLMDVLTVTAEVLNLSAHQVILKKRLQQKGRSQYQSLDTKNKTVVVSEGKARFKVNITDYLDTGLFLDHRIVRGMFGQMSDKKTFLNCFCYTATASVHAALSGMKTVSVDMSRTYLNWALENFKLNHLTTAHHELIQADCMEWLKTHKGRYDVIFLDPPSFSNSKRMTQILDIQKDHPQLIKDAARLLATDGVLYFSTNLKRFKLNEALLTQFDIHDITAQTIDEDFKRRPRIHQCFTIKHTLR